MPTTKRQWEIDALRGLMLVLMTVTHVPSRLTDPLGQPFGFVSAAEGFVLLSAFVSGMVYSRVGASQGVHAMRKAFWHRALKVYASQAALLLFVFTVVVAIGQKIDQPAVSELLKYYVAHPHEGLMYSLLLIYQPALLDILPMYILFMLMSPWVLAYAMRHGWTVPIVVSATCWATAQFGITPWLYELTSNTSGVPVPFDETGSFDTFAWQFLWFFGLWMGASRNAPDARPITFPKWLVALAVAVALTGFVWRHFGPTGQAAFGDNMELNLLFDKWRLGPLRLIDLAALGIVAMRFGPALTRLLPRMHWMEAMGASSLSVFCAHLVAVLLVLATFGGSQTARPAWGDALLLAVIFAGLYGVARAVAAYEARDKRPPAPDPTTTIPAK
jgi:hypothetical protein